MTFVDMDSIDFSQPRNKADLSGDRRHTTSNNGVPIVDRECKTSTTFEPHDESSGRLQDYNLIESLDMTVPRMEVLDPFCELALTNAKGKLPRL